MPATDPFATAALRERVLAAWSASPARFREDANAEEDLARGAYRDRVVVELAQNAADAAARAGVPGRLLLRLTEGLLTAANTGAALDAAAVESLSTLRASAKRDEARSAGRFGVGFAAVLAVSDEPSIASRTGAVRWSRSRAVELAASRPGLTEELARRGTAVPVLRLPFAAEDDQVDGYDTVVRLPLRDTAAQEAVASQLHEVDDALLLTLPALAEVAVEVAGTVRVLRTATEGDDLVVTATAEEGERTSRWRLVRRSGPLAADLLADRPVEERERPWWDVLVAVPVGADGSPVRLPPSLVRVLHAPTPSDEPVSLAALLVASVPLDPSRRHTVTGPLRDAVLDHLAAAYVELLVALPAEPAVLDLLPPALAAGELDAVLARAVLDRLRAVPFLPAADGTGRLRVDDAVLVPGLAAAADPAALGEVVGGLVDPEWWRRDALARLDVREVPLTEVVDALGGLELTPERWRQLYAALDGADRESLAALPVPLADGRLVRGPRGVLVPEGEDRVDPASWEPVTRLGVRIVHPAATHPLLLRLGAEPATPAAVLRHPALRAAVEQGEDVSDAVLPLVAASGASLTDEPWLGDLALTDADGELRAARELFLPDSAVLDWLDADEASVVAGGPVRRWGSDTLRSVGVRDELGTVHDSELALDGEVWHDLADEDAWVDATLTRLPQEEEVPPVLAELVAVRDLDLVRDEAWPEVLGALARPPYRDAVLAPALLRLGDGSHRRVPSYTRWWLSTHVRVDGRPLGERRLPDADAVVAALWDPLDRTTGAGLDPELAAAVGVRSTLARLLEAPGGADDLLDRLASGDREVPASVLLPAYDALATADPDEVTPPDRVRVPRGAGSVVVDAELALVAGAPYWAQLPDLALVPSTAEYAPLLAEVLDLPVAEDRHPVDLGGLDAGTRTAVPDAVAAVLPGAPTAYVEHDDLRVAGVPVTWWVQGDTVHACTLDGLARGLAWAAGRWADRLVVAEVLRDPDAVDLLLAEAAFGAR